MKFLITGANGFIGSNLALKIRTTMPTADITLLDLKIDRISLLNKDFSLIEKNLLQLNPSELPEVDVVFHAAALLGVDYVNSNPGSVVLENIATFLPLKNYLDNPNVKLVFFSTSEVYGDGQLPSGGKISNSSSMRLSLPDLSENRSSYAISKIVGEYINSRSSSYINLRPHNIYGPNMGDRHVIPNLIEKIMNLAPDEDLKIFNPTHVRSFCYINDAVNQVLHLVGSDKSGNYNIGNPHEPITIFELAQMLLQKMKKKNNITRLPGTKGSPSFRRPEIDYLDRNYVDLSSGLDEMINAFTESE